jgi:hypothetical protein
MTCGQAVGRGGGPVQHACSSEGPGGQELHMTDEG